MKNLFVLIVVLFVAALSVSVTLYFMNFRYAYIDTVSVYSGFKLTRELDESALKSKNLRKGVLDSLQLEIQVLERKIESVGSGNKEMLEQYQLKVKIFYETKQRFEEDNSNMEVEYNKQIWNQLNQYIKDYGDINGYHLIFGATGSGSLMYANESMNISTEMLEYVNYRYGGGSK